MLGGALVSMTTRTGSGLLTASKFLSDPNVALLLAVLVGFYTLGLRRGRNMEALMKSMGTAAASISMVILIIAAGGAFKQVLIDCGTGDAIKDIAAKAQFSPSCSHGLRPH